jgi:4-amino-4-deoxy-L-arabinose transferase-like glycosyltransferase
MSSGERPLRVAWRLPVSMRASAWSAAAWAAIGATVAFVALTCWWLTQDHAMPYGDAAEHLLTAFVFHEDLSSGDLLGPLRYESVYSPLTPFVGSLGIFLGGRTVAAPVLAENLVFVPLLALGCYHVGRLAFGRTAGALAVVFALGSPLLIEQFHVLMLDAPEAALVATCVWLVLASDRFRRVDLAAAAGAAAGFGLIGKQSFALYVAGFVALVLLRGGGWRNWRGLAAFLVVAFAIAAPWYLVHLTEAGTFTGAAGGGPTVPPLAKPPLASLDNLLWYFWATANGLLFAPLLTFAVVGAGVAAVAVARRRDPSDLVPELIGGLVFAWLALTVLPHHDLRYTMPLIVYVAALATGWIPRLARTPRTVAIGLLAAAVAAATLGATFGVGHHSDVPLPGNRFAPRGEGVPATGTLTVYAAHDLLVSGPRDGGDFLGLLKTLRRSGVRQILWSDAEAPLWETDYNANGLLTFARMARLPVPSGGSFEPSQLEAHQALMLRRRALPGAGPPCARLPNGDGVWVSIGAPTSASALSWCASRSG